MRTFDKMHDDCRKAQQPCAYWGDNGDWLCVLGQSRDSDTIERSNFQVACDMFDEIDPDGYTIERESHWAVGWVETLLVDPSKPDMVQQAEDIQAALEDYPLLDEMHHSNLEYEEYMEWWEYDGESQLRREIEKRLENRGLNRLAALVYEIYLSDALEYARQHVAWEYCGDDVNIDGLAEVVLESSPCPFLDAVKAHRAKRHIPVPIPPMPVDF